MADNLMLDSTLTLEQAEAATNALICFENSAEDFFRYRNVYTEAVETKQALLRTKNEVQEKNEVIQKLESAILVFTSGGIKEVNRAKVEIAEAKHQLQKVTEENREIKMVMKDTRQSLTKKEKECAEMQSEVSELREKVETLTMKLQSEMAAKEDATSRLGAAKIQLGVYDSYTANLVELNITKVSRSMTAIWESVDSLVKRYFSLDISDVLFEDHDKWIQQTCSFLRLSSGSILIPPTNSPAAKFARQAVMLNILALTLVKWIFTAAPLRLARAGLDDILSAIMEQDPRKEAILRAMLISKSTESTMDDKEIQDLLQWFLDTFGILATPKARTDMKKDLRQLFDQASRSWMESRRSYQKVVATFDLKSFPNSWKGYPEPHYRREQKAKHSQTSEPDDEDELAFFAFPAIIVKRNAVEATVHRGVLIYCSHLREAEHEWGKEQKNRRFSRTGVPRTIINPPLI